MFYYADTRNERIGPVTWDVLEQLHRAGVVADETLVCPEGGNDWLPFSEQSAPRHEPSDPPSVATHKRRSRGKRRSERDKKESIGWRTVAVVLGIIALFVVLPYLLTLSDDPRLYEKVSLQDPEGMPLTEIASAIESMPQAHHRIPDPGGVNEGVMLLFTGENSVQIRAIPDHPGLFQIDLTRYGVVYDDLPSDPGTRNALTLVLNLGTEFQNGKWTLVHAKGGSVDQVTKPGRSVPDEKTNESIPLEEAMWHGQWAVDFLNGETPDPNSEKQNAARYQLLEDSFLQEHQKIEGIRAQGIRLPE